MGRTMTGVQSSDVFLGDAHVGFLAQGDDGHLRFEYQSDWCVRGWPLSISLPLRSAPDPVKATNWFRQLLPDPDVCRRIADHIDVSLANEGGLLKELAGDAPGSIHVAHGVGDNNGEGSSYRPLNEHELHELLFLTQQRPLLAGVENVHLLLAGSGDKLPLFCDGVRLYVPLGDSFSSHIVRFQPDLASEALENEAFCMMLARAMGLPVVDCQLRDGVDRLLLVERIDRAVRDGQVQCLHQETFCQALGLPPGRFFEQEGGASLKDCFELLRHYSIRPAVDIRALLDWVIFTTLIGASGSHAGRLALLLSADGPYLAPFSGICCTIWRSGGRAAMAIGGCYEYEALGERHWRVLAEETGIHFRLIRQRLCLFADRLLPAGRATAETFRRQYGESHSLGQIIATLMSAAGTLSWLK